MARSSVWLSSLVCLGALAVVLIPCTSLAEPLEASSAGLTPTTPVIVEGRIVQVERLEGSGSRLTIEVDEVLQGFVPGSTLVVESPADTSRPLRRLLQPGERLRWVLVERDDGSYRLQNGHRVSPSPEPLLPGGLTVTLESEGLADGQELSEPSDLSKLAAASSATPTFEERVVEIVNQERLANGNLPPLKENALLNAASELHSGNMASRDFFAHCDPDTLTQPVDRVRAEGYFPNLIGENAAAGQSTPESVMSAWMASSGHRANILRTSFRELGVGYALQSTDTSGVRRDSNGDCVPDSTGGPYFRYWTQNFGWRSGIYPVVIEREAHTTETRSVDLYLYGTGWAQEMRFSNDQSTWSSWQAFNPTKSWELSFGSGVKTVYAQIRNGGSVLQASDTIFLDSPCTIQTAILNLSQQTVNGTQTFEACDQITAQSNFQVMGNVTFRAGQRIVLGNGFSVRSGASFQAVIQTP